MKVTKVISGLNMWDVTYNGTLIQRFDTKWEALAFVKQQQVNLGAAI